MSDSSIPSAAPEPPIHRGPTWSISLRAIILCAALILGACLALLPRFADMKERQRVSSIRSEMRQLATALESYFVDNMRYPMWTKSTSSTVDPPAPAGITVPSTVTFARYAKGASTLTTPVAYMTGYFHDPYADRPNASFRFFSDENGWIVGSFGPDRDEKSGGDLGWDRGADIADSRSWNPEIPRPDDIYATSATADIQRWKEAYGIQRIYVSRVRQPSSLILTGSLAPGRDAFTYDPTNGTKSSGDIYRVRM